MLIYSNIRADEPILFHSPDDLADHILKTKYKANKLDYTAVDIDFHIYQFTPRLEGQPIIQKAVVINAPQNSPNKFNAFHYAVMANDTSKLEALLKSEQNAHALLIEKDAHGLTPIERGITLGNIPCSKAMINALPKTEDLTLLALVAASHNQISLLEHLLNTNQVNVSKLFTHYMNLCLDRGGEVAALNLGSKALLQPNVTTVLNSLLKHSSQWDINEDPKILYWALFQKKYDIAILLLNNNAIL